MPPRRSNRLSVEPPEQPPVLSKRSKRGLSVDVEEKENDELSTTGSTRSRRGSSAAPAVSGTKRKVSGRAKNDLSDVQESADEEENPETPVKKKPRPSTSDDEEFDATPKPKPKRGKATSRKPSSKVPPPPRPQTPPPPSAAEIHELEDEDVAFLETPTKRTPRRSKAKPPPRGEPEDEEEDNATSLLDHTQSVPRPIRSSPVKSQPTMPKEPEGPKARLVIHKMALVNFKSYAGRQEIGPFHKSFSAIVGPNGSGKSNTIDALLFVFGYRANKMRQSKLSELIHNSARFPDLEFCTVEVHFREIIDLATTDGFETVPNSDLVVARTALRDNKSSYTVNGRTKKYNEVRDLLKDKGIDLDHNRFLILQGEVESIAQMPPKSTSGHDEGLLEYLEDIIGSVQYKEPIDTALVEMEKLEEDRREKMNRLKFTEKERDQLKGKKQEAVDYLRRQNDLAKLRSHYYQFGIAASMRKETEMENRVVQFENKLVTEKERNEENLAHLKALEDDETEKGAAYTEVKSLLDAASKELGKHKAELAGEKVREKHARSALEKSTKAKVADEKAIKTAKITIEDSAEKIEKENKSIKKREKELKEAQTELERIQEGLRDKTKDFHAQIEVHQAELQPWQQKMNAKEADINVATSERDAILDKVEKGRQNLTNAEKELEELKGDLNVKKEMYVELQNKKAGQGQEIANAKAALQQARSREQQLKENFDSQRAKYYEVKNAQDSMKSQGKVLDSLTKLKTQGRLDGFHGRLGSMGTIDAKYDTAVTTACGALNNIVVDSVKCAETALDYMRKNNIGRATFMALDKVRALPKVQDLPPAPEGCPYLFELVKPKDDMYRPCFWKALGRTVVAKDMDQAKRVAFNGTQRYRVVTLNGQIIETSGAMSGGGGAPQKGGMSSKLAKDTSGIDVEALGIEVDRLGTEVQQVGEMVARLEGELEEVKESVPKVEMEMKKLEMDIKSGDARVKDAKKALEEAKAHTTLSSKDQARVKELDKAIEKHSADLATLKSQSSAIEEAIADLNEKIMQVGGVHLLAQKSKVDSINQHISLSNEEITKAEVAQSAAEKAVKKHEKQLREHDAALETQKAELEELEETVAQREQIIATSQVEVDEAEQAEETLKEQLENLASKLKEAKEALREYTKLASELNQKIEDAKKEKARATSDLNEFMEAHDQLELIEIEDDDDEVAASGEADKSEVIPKAEGENENDAMDETPDATPAVKKDPDAPRDKRIDDKGFYQYPEHELLGRNEEEAKAAKREAKKIQANMVLLEEELKKAMPDLEVLNEWKEREKQFLQRADELAQATEMRDNMKNEYERLRSLRLVEFMSGFSTISLKLKEMYQMITLGGNAELELVDSLDPFSEGIIFSVMPPKKSWKNISNLSGGEKTLSSLALVFALHVFKPTPLYFMDEIDAALDFRNVSIVANYIKDRTKNAQFIIISLRNDMFELSHRLIGIYKTANVTKSIAIDNKALQARQAGPEEDEDT